MRFQDDIAAIIRANQFELIDPVTGVAAADLVSEQFVKPITLTPYNGAALQMHHHNPLGVTDSQLAWSTDETLSPNNSALALIGPAEAGATIPPEIFIDYNSASRRSELYLTSGNGTLAGVNGSTASLDLTNGGPTSAGATLAAPVIQLNASSALILDPDNALAGTGRLKLGAAQRGAYLPLGMQELQSPQIPNGTAVPASNNFLINGITISGQPGDQIMVHCTFVLQDLGGAQFRAAFQIFGPSGNVVSSERMGWNAPAAGNIATVSGTLVYTLALGTGNYTVTVTGGMIAGTANSYDTWMQVEHHGIR